MTLNEFKEKIKKTVVEYWEKNKSPLLLSQLPVVLDNGEYEQFVEPSGWKSFLTSTSSEQAGYKLVQHPQQLAKIGLIPYDVTFDYRNSEEKIEISAELLLSILSKLDSKQLKNIQLPADITLALVKYRLTH